MLFMLQNCTRVQISVCKVENRWTSWIHWEWGRYSTAIISRTATRMPVALCHFGGAYETSQTHIFYLRVRVRAVQRIWAIIISWTQSSIVVNINAVTGFSGQFRKSQSVFPSIRKWRRHPLQNNPLSSLSPSAFHLAHLFCTCCRLLQTARQMTSHSWHSFVVCDCHSAQDINCLFIDS